MAAASELNPPVSPVALVPTLSPSGRRDRSRLSQWHRKCHPCLPEGPGTGTAPPRAAVPVGPCVHRAGVSLPCRARSGPCAPRPRSGVWRASWVPPPSQAQRHLWCCRPLSVQTPVRSAGCVVLGWRGPCASSGPWSTWWVVFVNRGC